MAATHGPKKPVVAVPRPSGAIHPHRTMLAVAIVVALTAAITGTVVAASTGHTTAALVIAVVTGGWFSAALC
ncbi:hypothetical protein [Mycobacterium paraseoulense]|uniref:Uncharacterized protein n=1 Tax=Mycobacterium paraseoulense TaxID=590652 RepID=A0A1X0I9I1_9MYCO|nr:hypothetical protein [Mycobacterium paraseoulense]MCV7394351.1 hypothetical protein [Mycobacterium paraseoulense]ORB40239.1 hypothetical protein BST39_14195 [Mycobacterium paraseoulense]BBZ74116.1 hypothetical protein MPRS_52090 [Mycobacterium paraseoulense]